MGKIPAGLKNFQFKKGGAKKSGGKPASSPTKGVTKGKGAPPVKKR